MAACSISTAVRCSTVLRVPSAEIALQEIALQEIALKMSTTAHRCRSHLQRRPPARERGHGPDVLHERLLPPAGEVAAEVADAGLRLGRMVAAESPLWLAGGQLTAILADPVQTALMLDLLREIETEPSLLGATSDLIAVVYPRRS